MSTPPIPPGDAPLTPAGSAPAKAGKGKLIGIIAGVLVIVAGLVFAGITYGPGLWAKSKGGGGDLNATDGGGEGLPSLTQHNVSRKLDGLWYQAGSSTPFTGGVVHEEEDNRWEEKFEKGVRTFLRAWDKDGDPVELHAWNADGSPRN